MNRFVEVKNWNIDFVDTCEPKIVMLNIDTITTIESVSNDNRYYEVSTFGRRLCIDKDDLQKILSKARETRNTVYGMDVTTDKPHKVIPRGIIPNQLKWLARDANGVLYVYENKPTKSRDLWYDAACGYYEKILGDMFENVKWEDDEPTRIED